MYRVTGLVTAADGSEYVPLYWGDFFGMKRVVWAIKDGCKDRGDKATIIVDRGPLSDVVKVVEVNK